MIIDCHVHLPSPSLGVTIEWAPFTPDVASAIAYLKRCGVERAIAASFRATEARTPGEMRAGNDETMELAHAYPEILIPGCCVNPNYPDKSIAELRRCREAGIVWVHELVGYIADYTYDTEGFARTMAAASDLGMVVQIHSEGTEMDRICGEFPQVTWVLAHLGDSREECRARCELAAKHPNLYLDLSGHGIQRMGVLDLAVRCAGPERVLFGSDYRERLYGERSGGGDGDGAGVVSGGGGEGEGVGGECGEDVGGARGQGLTCDGREWCREASMFVELTTRPGQ